MIEEKQKHKLTRSVLDQSLALSIKLLNEVKTLDVKLYQEKQRNKASIQHDLNTSSNCKERFEHMKRLQNTTSESGSKYNSDEHSGMNSDFIKKSTDEIENIIRKIQFDSEKKQSAEKPPQPPKINTIH